MEGVADPITQALLDDWQRGFPVVPKPFKVLAQSLGIGETDVIGRLEQQHQGGRITRVGATCAPNTLSASTLAAIAAPEHRIDEIVALIDAEPGINHSYLREDNWNLWFVATGPDRAHVDAALERISQRSGLQVMDLRLVRPFNVDLGFALRSGPAHKVWPRKKVDLTALQTGDRALVQALMLGLPLTSRPYRDVAKALGRAEDTVLRRVSALIAAGIIARLGVIVRHRALGWRANAMVVWDMTPEQITLAGPVLAAQPGVTLCYERTPVPGVWPYRLYSMIHARNRPEALATLARVSALPELAGTRHKPLFSLHCYKQTGALVGRTEGARA